MFDPNQPPLYRYVTTKNIRAGDVILEEESWMWSFMNLGGAKLVCNYCFKTSSKLLSCSACKSAFYCDATCQRNDWRFRHKHDECRNLKAIRQMARETPGAVTDGFEEVHFNALVPHLLLSTASTRLYDAEGRDEKGNPTTLLWKTFMQTPYKADLVDLYRDPQTLLTAVCRLVEHKDTAGLIIQNRILPSLVVLWNLEPWKKALEGLQYSEKPLPMPEQLALGACLEMSKYPNSCDRPNTITINDGRTVRMVAMEDIQNLEQVRLTRLPLWLHEFRYTRRTWYLHEAFGYGCFCSRCNAGDTAAETTLFALRCPQWAKHYPQVDNKQACGGYVKGLRRTDFSDLGVNRMARQSYNDADEPRPLPYYIAHAPPHERAVCQQCNARYDAETMRTKILPLLRLMETMRLKQQDPNSLATGENNVLPHMMCDEWASASMQAEQYVYPSNCVYLVAKRALLKHIMVGMLAGHSSLHTDVALWVKNYVREVLARVEADGCQQIDFYGLQEMVTVYGYYANVARHSRHRVKIDAETRELMVTTAKRATEKVKLFLQMRRT